MNTKILIIGNTTEELNLGAMLVEAAKEVDNISIFTCSNSLNVYAPSMSNLHGKLFYKISGGRAIEWWDFNTSVINSLKVNQPDLVIVTGIFPLEDRVFFYCKEHSIKIVNYLTDSPFNIYIRCPKFMDNIKRYSIMYTTKKAIFDKLTDCGAEDVRFLLFAFDPHQHCLPNQDDTLEAEFVTYPDVCIVGGADPDRVRFVVDFLKIFNGSLGLYGGDWNKYKEISHLYKGYVKYESYRRVLNKSKLNVGLVKRLNQDEHSMRSFEIAACGGVGVYEDTSVHRALIPDYPDYGFFSSPEDLADKCNYLLTNSTEREEMRQLGIKFIANESNTYTARLKTILECV
jgi:spore maturation protein CgeB